MKLAKQNEKFCFGVFLEGVPNSFASKSIALGQATALVGSDEADLVVLGVVQYGYVTGRCEAPVLLEVNAPKELL